MTTTCTHRARSSSRWLMLAGLLWLAAVAPRASAQAPPNFAGCVAEALTQSTALRPDGSYVINNIPTNTGQIFSVLITCPTANGGTLRALSPPLALARRQNLILPPFPLVDRGPNLMKLTLRVPLRTLARVGDRVFTVVAGDYPDGTQRNLTYPQTGTSFRSSNPKVATVDATGCVTAAAPGVAAISAFNSGRTAAARISVSGGADSDGDGMPDACEIANGLDPTNPTDGAEDPDGDGLDNVAECANGTNPFVADTDGDGLDDRAEVARGTDPLNPDTDGDGLLDGGEMARGTDPLNPNTDGDCLPDGAEVLLGTNPLMPGDDQGDADADGLSNCAEVAAGTDPTKPDTDGDGINDGEEIVAGTDGVVTNPLNADTDGDGMNDGAEVAFGSNPTDPTDLRTQVILDGRTSVVNGRIRLNSLTLRNGAVLTHAGATATRTSALELEVTGTLSVDATSRIDVTGRGYLNGRSGDNTGDEGRTFGNRTVGGSTNRNGGSYGGLGAIADETGTVNAVYGDFHDPNELGSGGATRCFGGGLGGGGLVRILANSVQLDGTIVADGGAARHGCAGGGSGGGIKITANTLSGSGSIHANGSLGGDGFAAGGGGGRIALFYMSGNFNVDNVQALGGGGQQIGGPGTIYVKQGVQPGQLIVRGTGRDTPLPEGISGDRVVVDGAMVSEQQGTPVSLTLRNGAVLTHPAATSTTSPRLELAVGTLTIDATSRIDVSARGYLNGRSGDNTGDMGRTFGNATAGGSTNRNGGSYGGLGAIADATGTVSPGYGDFRDPNELGSGGGTSCFGGAFGGGGLVRIAANSISLDGVIVADGGAARHGCAGGGSGGGIKLTTGTLSGSGSIRANGSLGGDGFAAGGGGGRIAVVYVDASGFDFENVHALGGTGQQNGAAGTVYLAGPSGSELRVDAAGVVSPQPTQLVSLGRGTSSAVGANTLTDSAAAFIPGALIGLSLNPNATQEGTFHVTANDATSITTDPADGDLRAMATAGDGYVAQIDVDQLTITNRAMVEILDGNRNRPDRRGMLDANTIRISSLGRLVHPAATSTAIFGLDLNVTGALSIDAMSAIDVSARGLLGGRTGDNTADAGRTFGNTTVGGSTIRSGGSYGGLGGIVGDGATRNALYGDPRDPNDAGSGGAVNCFGGADSGGGLVRLTTGSLRLDGVIAADGGALGHGCAGGGSGGGIKITTGTLSGSGRIHADGAVGGGGFAGGGGGGRIAVFYTDVSAFPLANVQALGGSGLSNGEAGTVVVEQAP